MSSSDSGAEASHPGDDGGSYAEWVGRTIDERYRIEGLLGEGGMGAVFEATHLKLAKTVALKVIHPEFAGDGEVAKRFAREAMASAQMEHPHVASATDYGTLPEGGAYLVMRLVRGQSLREVLDDEGAIGWVRACEVGAQVADALSAAHKHEIVHRDLKPDNVMLEPRDDGSHLVKVLDFGIARVANEKAGVAGQALTRVGTVIGTPGYMAPEQALGEPVDYRVDLYALGLLIYEMTTGEKVFDLDDLTAIVTRQLTEDAPRLADEVADVPAVLDELVASLLRKDRDQRPASAGDVREALRSLLLGATLEAVRSGEHPLPRIGTTELAGASAREPTPLGVETQKPDPATPPAASAATLHRASVPTPVRKVTAAATAKTALALGQVKRSVERGVEQSGLPARPIALGCAALLAGTLLIVGISALIGGGGSDLPKLEHDEPLPAEILEEVAEPEEDPEEEDTASASGTVPAALSQAQADLLLSDSRNTRRRAARSVERHEPQEEVPPFLAALAQLERASSCNAKKEHVERLGQLGDVRALPALERMDAEPRDGCRRMFRRYDCYHCMRDELGDAIEALHDEM